MGRRAVVGQDRLPGMERDYEAEQANALAVRAKQLGEMRVKRMEGTLGDDFTKFAQFNILCALPYSPTIATRVTRRSRLSDGSKMSVTFSAVRDGVALPFGGDRRLVMWLFDQALCLDSPTVPWDSGSRYLRDMGMKESGKNRQDLRDRFDRVSGLAIVVERKGIETCSGEIVALLKGWHLPSSIAGEGIDAGNVQAIDEGKKPYCFELSPALWREIKAHHVVLPRSFWAHLKGSWRVQDAMIWLVYRLYGAQSESGITWAQLREQLPQDDSNSQRMKVTFRTAVKQLLAIWPEAGVEVMRWGLQLKPSSEMLLPDDPSRNRVRKLPRVKVAS